MTTTTKTPAPANVVKGRPAHELNDVLVTIREGAAGEPVYKNGARILGGHGNVGTVWMVSEGKAVVHFAAARATVLVPVADLVRA